jgi:hypothetical protein
MLLIVGNGIIASSKIALPPPPSSGWPPLPPVHSASTLGDVGGLLTGIGTLLLFVVAVVAAKFAKAQVDQQKDLARRQRVYEHLAQLYDRDFVLMMSAAQELFEERPPDESGWENAWEALDGDTKSEIVAAMNFFEIVAGEYNDPREYLDKEAAQKALLVIADGLWEQAAPFVYWARKGSDPRSYEQWEKMSRRADRTVLPLRTTETEPTTGAEAPAPESPALGPPELINNVVEACQAVVNDLTALATLTDPKPDDLLQLGRDLQSVCTERERLPPSGMRVKVIDLVRLVRPVLRSEVRATRELVAKVAAAFDAVRQARENARHRKD